VNLILMRHAERDKSSGLEEDRQRLTSAGRIAVRLVARALTEAHAGSLGAIIASPFNPAVETAELAADELHGPTVVTWDELSPKHSGNGLRSRLEKLMHDMTAPLGILVVGHQPRLNQLIHADGEDGGNQIRWRLLPRCELERTYCFNCRGD
jgi:phosphohistidine phosphatase SixA